MRIKTALILTAVAGAIALPASAQTYQRNCANTKNSSQLGGAVVGSIIGGVLGNNIATNGHRGDGTTVGAVLGGLVGAGVGGSSVRCEPLPLPLPPPAGTYAPGYGSQYGSGYGYQQPTLWLLTRTCGAYRSILGIPDTGATTIITAATVGRYGNSSLYQMATGPIFRMMITRGGTAQLQRRSPAFQTAP